jgi:hypothetical protein
LKSGGAVKYLPTGGLAPGTEPDDSSDGYVLDVEYKWGPYFVESWEEESVWADKKTWWHMGDTVSRPQLSDVINCSATQPSENGPLASPPGSPELGKYGCDTVEGVRATVAAPLPVHKWVVDTGSAFDLVGRNIGEAVQGRIRQSAAPLMVQTANGPTSTSSVIDAQLNEMSLEVSAHILQDTPALLSVGRRCMHDGALFV